MSELNRRRRNNGLDGIKPAFERLTDGLSTLVKQHLELARYEITQDVSATGKRLAVLGVCAAIGLVGYIMLLVAGFLFAGWLGGWLAAWITAGGEALANLALAGGLAAYFGKQLREEKPIDLAQTSDELDKDKRWLQNKIAQNSLNGEKPAAQLSHDQLPPS